MQRSAPSRTIIRKYKPVKKAGGLVSFYKIRFPREGPTASTGAGEALLVASSSTRLPLAALCAHQKDEWACTALPKSGLRNSIAHFGPHRTVCNALKRRWTSVWLVTSSAGAFQPLESRTN
jgi:hypothetical protein